MSKIYLKLFEMGKELLQLLVVHFILDLIV